MKTNIWMYIKRLWCRHGAIMGNNFQDVCMDCHKVLTNIGNRKQA